MTQIDVICAPLLLGKQLILHRPSGELIRLNLFKSLDSLMKNGADAGRMFSGYKLVLENMFSTFST